MIIQCEQCRTKFKLDDSKVPEKGVKVRCAKCRHVFSVAKEQPETGSATDFGEMLDATVSSGQTADEEQPGFAVPDLSEIEFEESAKSQEGLVGESRQLDAAAFEMQDEQETIYSPDASSSDLSAFSADHDHTFTPAQDEPADTSDDIDFGAFAFSDDGDDADTSATAAPTLDFGNTPRIEPAPAESHTEEFGGLDFSGDDMFGEVVPATPEESPEPISFDFGTDDFSASMGGNDSAVNQKNAFTITEASSDAPFSLDEIDFGEEFTAVGVQHVSPEELKPSQEQLFAPLAEAQAKPVLNLDKATQAPQEELPPLSIASRRKQSPRFTALVAAAAIIIAAVLVFFGYSMFSGDKLNNAQETGRISVGKVDATFVKNKLIGNLLVISGEAVNEYSKPRAAIQVKGMVYGADGKVVSSKNAFCGNPLTDDQLATMSMGNIEAAMSNQFGDSLGNMEVAPGKAIPFVIVIANPPAGAKDYGVEAAGSTLATDKMQ